MAYVFTSLKISSIYVLLGAYRLYANEILGNRGRPDYGRVVQASNIADKHPKCFLHLRTATHQLVQSGMRSLTMASDKQAEDEFGLIPIDSDSSILDGGSISKSCRIMQSYAKEDLQTLRPEDHDRTPNSRMSCPGYMSDEYWIYDVRRRRMLTISV